MNSKDACDKWMDYVYDNWITAWIRTSLEETYMRQSTKNIVERMKKAVSQPMPAEEAWSLLERVKRLTDGFLDVEDAQEQRHLHERPETYMECARVAYKLGDSQEALSALRLSIREFPTRSLYKAVSYWMLGCIQWLLPAHSESAVISWERSAQIINEIRAERYNDAERERDYEDVIEQMRSAIDSATKKGYPLPPPFRSSDGVAKKNNLLGSLNPFFARLKLLPYFGAIPAGGPSVVDNHPDMIDVEALEIQSQFYNIFGVRGEQEVRMKPSSRYFLAKANGDSMNIADPVSIEDQDYVLLEATQSATARDIVAAVIFDVTGLETATLKRYRMENGRQVLRSESDIDNYVFTMSGKDYIQGVVVAILKPQ